MERLKEGNKSASSITTREVDLCPKRLTKYEISKSLTHQGNITDEDASFSRDSIVILD